MNSEFRYVLLIMYNYVYIQFEGSGLQKRR